MMQIRTPINLNDPKQGIYFGSPFRVRKPPLFSLPSFTFHVYEITTYLSVRGLERSELGGSHGCPGRIWDRFLWKVYQNDSRHDALDGV